MSKKQASLFVAVAGIGVCGAVSSANVIVTVGEPDFYGRLDVGNIHPALINQSPVIIERTSQAPQPVYLRVRPGYERDWSKHCQEYNACGEPVYFVTDDWYRTQYAPKYRQEHPRDEAPADRRERQLDRKEDRLDRRQEQLDRKEDRIEQQRAKDDD